MVDSKYKACIEENADLIKRIRWSQVRRLINRSEVTSVVVRPLDDDDSYPLVFSVDDWGSPEQIQMIAKDWYRRLFKHRKHKHTSLYRTWRLCFVEIYIFSEDYHVVFNLKTKK